MKSWMTLEALGLQCGTEKGIKKGIEKFVTTRLFESNIFWKVKKKNLFNEIQLNY